MEPLQSAAAEKAEFGAGLGATQPLSFHLVKNMCYFPLLGLKGIYHYWKSYSYCFFRGPSAKGFLIVGSPRRVRPGTQQTSKCSRRSLRSWAEMRQSTVETTRPQERADGWWEGWEGGRVGISPVDDSKMAGFFFDFPLCFALNRAPKKHEHTHTHTHKTAELMFDQCISVNPVFPWLGGSGHMRSFFQNIGAGFTSRIETLFAVLKHLVALTVWVEGTSKRAGDDHFPTSQQANEQNGGFLISIGDGTSFSSMCAEEDPNGGRPEPLREGRRSCDWNATGDTVESRWFDIKGEGSQRDIELGQAWERQPCNTMLSRPYDEALYPMVTAERREHILSAQEGGGRTISETSNYTILGRCSTTHTLYVD